MVETPFSNQKLIENAGKSGRLEAILNRGEFRILENQKGELLFDMTGHFVPPMTGYTIKHSLQGGPLIYPNMNLENESFVIMQGGKVKFQAADVLKRRERTALALKNDILYIIIFTNQHKVTMNELKEFCKNLKVDKAMALDGGASTSLNYRNVEILMKNSVFIQAKFKKNTCIHAYMHTYLCTNVCLEVHRCQKRVLYSLKIEFHVFVSLLMWMLRFELWSSDK